MHEDNNSLYLELLKESVMGSLAPVKACPVKGNSRMKRAVYAPVESLLERAGLRLVRSVAEDSRWGLTDAALTLVSPERLDNLQACIDSVLLEGVPGDLMETGIWRGGAIIFMRGVLKARGVTDRLVWAADSFAGLPPPDPGKYPKDRGDIHHVLVFHAVPLERVHANLKHFGLLDDQVRFLDGWFRDTLPAAPVERLAVLRLDGDMYESTIQALEPLYPKLSLGGYLIVDDYESKPGCRAAVDDYRQEHGIAEPIVPVHGGAVYWRRER